MLNFLPFFKWVSDRCLTPNEKLISYIITRTSYIQWNDDHVRFVLNQHALIDRYIACSLTEQSTGRHVALLWHIMLIPTQPVFIFTP